MPGEVAALIKRDDASNALACYTSQLCGLLRRSPDREAPAVGTWKVGDVANHLASGIRNYARTLQGTDVPDLDAIEDMPRWNIEMVQGLPPANLPQLADQIEATTAEFIEAARAKPLSSEVPWYAGNRIPVEVAVCMRLIEAAVHGSDIAAALKQNWDLRPEDARIMSYGLAYIGPHFVDKRKLDFEGTVRIRIRGGADLYYIVREQQLHVSTAAPSADWHLSADAVAWVLVSVGRRSEWAAALRGEIIGWGRRPRLPFKLRVASFQG